MFVSPEGVADTSTFLVSLATWSTRLVNTDITAISFSAQVLQTIPDSVMVTAAVVSYLVLAAYL